MTNLRTEGDERYDDVAAVLAGAAAERVQGFVTAYNAVLDADELRRRQAEVSIAQAQASLQRIIDTAPLAIALFDAASGRLERAASGPRAMPRAPRP